MRWQHSAHVYIGECAEPLPRDSQFFLLAASFALVTVSAPPGSQLRLWRGLRVRVMRLLDEVVGIASCLSGRRQKEARFRESLPQRCILECDCSPTTFSLRDHAVDVADTNPGLM